VAQGASTNARGLAVIVAGVLGVAGASLGFGSLDAADSAARADHADVASSGRAAASGCHLHNRTGRAERDVGAAQPLASSASGPGPISHLTIEPGRPGPEISNRFLGLSLEYGAVIPYAGSSPDAINPVFVQLIRNISPGRAPSIRIGGDSTDWAWWPVAHMRQPPGVSYSITEPWVQVTKSLTAILGARLILGIDLEANNRRLAAVEARALSERIGTGSIAALELGNEPELYRSWGWYCSRSGREITGRPRSYGFQAFKVNFSAFANVLPWGPLAGPSIGIPTWLPHLSEFLAAEPRLGMVTLHRYPLQNYLPPSSPKSPSVSHLLSETSSQGLAAAIAPSVRVAHHHHLPLRVDELNNISAGQAPGVADAFASALWVIDALFEMANVGVDGVNIHTFPGAAYELFRFSQSGGRWQGFVAPEYYGLLMFARAAPPGSRLVALRGAHPSAIRAWATRGPGRTVRAVLINDGNAQARVALTAPGDDPMATLQLLQASSLTAVQGVTLGGQSFGGKTATGRLAGRSTVAFVKAAAHAFSVDLPAASAGLLTIP